MAKVRVGVAPNGLAYDHSRKLLLAANIGDPAIAGSQSVTMVDAGNRTVRAEIAMPGTTRWTVFDRNAEVFYVNITNPAVIAVINAREPDRLPTCSPFPQPGRTVSI